MTTTTPSSYLTELRSACRGAVLTPGEPGYDLAADEAAGDGEQYPELHGDEADLARAEARVHQDARLVGTAVPIAVDQPGDCPVKKPAILTRRAELRLFLS